MWWIEWYFHIHADPGFQKVPLLRTIDNLNFLQMRDEQKWVEDQRNNGRASRCRESKQGEFLPAGATDTVNVWGFALCFCLHSAQSIPWLAFHSYQIIFKSNLIAGTGLLIRTEWWSSLILHSLLYVVVPGLNFEITEDFFSTAFLWFFLCYPVLSIKTNSLSFRSIW